MLFNALWEIRLASKTTLGDPQSTPHGPENTCRRPTNQQPLHTHKATHAECRHRRLGHTRRTLQHNMCPLHVTDSSARNNPPAPCRIRPCSLAAQSDSCAVRRAVRKCPEVQSESAVRRPTPCPSWTGARRAVALSRTARRLGSAWTGTGRSRQPGPHTRTQGKRPCPWLTGTGRHAIVTTVTVAVWTCANIGWRLDEAPGKTARPLGAKLLRMQLLRSTPAEASVC
jgi:hypothetical protein